MKIYMTQVEMFADQVMYLNFIHFAFRRVLEFLPSFPLYHLAFPWPFQRQATKEHAVGFGVYNGYRSFNLVSYQYTLSLLHKAIAWTVNSSSRSTSCRADERNERNETSIIYEKMSF